MSTNSLSMGYEMGNNNVSGIKEEEKATAEVSEKAQELVPADEVKGENPVIPEDQTKDFREKGDFSSNGLSAASDSDAERRESNEKEIGGEESKNHSHSPEVSTESNNSSSRDSDIQKSASPDEGNYEKSLESNLEESISCTDILQIHDQPSTPKETNAQEVERSESTDSETTSQPSKTSSDSTRSLEESHCLPPNQSEEVPKMSETCNLEEKENAQKGISKKENIDDLVSEASPIIEDELLETKPSTENCDSKSTDDKFGDVLENQSDDQVPLRMNSSDFSDSSTEAALQYSSLDPSPEPQEKHVIHAKKNDLISSESEKLGNKQDSNKINSSEQALNESIVNDSSQLVTLQETSSKEIEEEMLQLCSNSALEKLYHTGVARETHKRSRSVLAGQKRCASEEQFEGTEEVIKMLHADEIISVSAELSSTDNFDDENRETGKTRVELPEKGEHFSSSRAAMNYEDRGTAKECTSGSKSFKWENGLLGISSAPKLNSQNGNETLLSSEAAEDRKKCTTNDLPEIFLNAISNLDAHKATLQSSASSSSLESFKPEHAINIQTTLGTSAENEVLSNQSNEQCPSGEMSRLPNGKTQESSARLSIESNPGQQGNQLQRSKSPSFDFGLQLDVRSEESDQTPLLHHDKTAGARSFSGFANVRFQNRIIQTDYGRQSLDFEPVAVEEKTIRVERSDSDISRASFMNLLKKDEKSNAQFSPQKQESPVADKNSENLSTDELALTSLKGSGKRKGRPSLFTSCICCTAAIH